MKIDEAYKRIDRYLAKVSGQPFIVDVPNRDELSSLTAHYNVGENNFIKASDFAAKDEFPRFDALYDKLSSEDKTLFVTGLSSFLRLSGRQELRNSLDSILNMTVAGRVVVITYQCDEILAELKDARLRPRICVIDGADDELPELVFMSGELAAKQNANLINGINELADAVEWQKDEKLCVKTTKNQASFPRSLYKISVLDNAFDILQNKDRRAELKKDFGTDDEWNFALEKFERHNSWGELIDLEFGRKNSLELVIPSLKGFDEPKKWLYFIALKLYGSKNDSYLDKAAKNATSKDDLIRQLFRCILESSPDDRDFEKLYLSRKKLISQFGDHLDETVDFCKLVLQKDRNAIFYLTDNTKREKEEIFALLAKYEYPADELFKILRLVYPDLLDYLSPFGFGDTLLDSYFQSYKYQKLENRILPEFEKLVEEQAEKRDFNLILEPRSSKLESIDRNGAQLYFVDALGVEYLSYIMAVCEKLKLTARVSVCCSELPSITSRNTDFIKLFENSEYPVVNIKELDEIKHHGIDNYDYQRTKLPIHLSGELDVISGVLERIRTSLVNGSIKKAIIVSDHGASRLAVISETENIWEMSTKGEHSGRCCPKSELDSKPSCAVDAGDFWALANYDRFRGGRKADVEVHGGATLEEVAVPIIELTYRSGKIEVCLLSPDSQTASGKPPVIEVSYRKKAALRIFSTEPLEEVRLCVNGKFYGAESVDDSFWSVMLPDIKKAGTYHADVYESQNLIAKGLEFIVKKEGSSEKELL